MAKNAACFSDADSATIFQLDGETLRVVAHHGSIPVDVGLLVPCVRGTASGRTVLERRALHVTDLQAESADFPEGSAFARRFGHRTTLSVPLLREETVRCRGKLALKNQALHQELAVYKRTATRPRLHRTDRLSRVGLASVPGWVQDAS